MIKPVKRSISAHSAKAVLLALAITIAISITLTPPSSACVGRKLVLGSLDADRPAMVSRLLSILINERTGTTVEVNYFAHKEDLLKAVGKGKVDLYVDAVDSALTRIGGNDRPLSEEERFRLVKRRFDEEQNLVWLKPMGYVEKDEEGASGGPAAVVVRKDTLKTFPALPRLLEKIGSRVVLDDDLLDSLVKRGQGEKPSRVAREYLKEVKLI